MPDATGAQGATQLAVPREASSRRLPALYPAAPLARAVAQAVETATPTDEFPEVTATRTPALVPLPLETLTLVFPTRPVTTPSPSEAQQGTIQETDRRGGDSSRPALLALVFLLWVMLAGWVYLWWRHVR